MKGRAFLLLALALITLEPGPLHAEITPRAGDGDPHIQTVGYDPQQVVALHVAGGYAVTVIFSPDERIETVTLGDSSGWQVSVNKRADHLVVKPTGNPQPTNLTVMSDQRSYNFTLYGAGPGEGVQPYLVSFTYPDNPAEPAQAQALVPPAGVAAALYKLRGDKSLWPAAISDDGLTTAIRWRADQAIPAIYQEDEDNHLALINGLMQGGAYRIEGMHRRLMFVAGRARATATRLAPRP